MRVLYAAAAALLGRGNLLILTCSFIFHLSSGGGRPRARATKVNWPEVGYCLSPEPGLRPGRTRHAKIDLSPVQQGPLRSYLRSATQGHAFRHGLRHLVKSSQSKLYLFANLWWVFWISSKQIQNEKELIRLTSAKEGNYGGGYFLFVVWREY